MSLAPGGRIQGDAQILNKAETRRINEGFEINPILTKDSAGFLKTAGTVTLPSSATLIDYDNNIKSWRIKIKFASAGIAVNYFDNTLAFTSSFAGQTVIAQMTDQAPLNIGTWDFYLLSTQSSSSFFDSWKNDTLTCGLVQPGAPAIGQRFLNLTTQQIEVWNGTIWVVEPTLPGDSVLCQSNINGVYVKTGGVWSFFNFESSTPGLGITITANVVATDNGDGLTYVGNKNTVLAAPLGGITVGPAGVSVKVDNKTNIINGAGEIAKKSYTQSFNASTDWTSIGGGDYIITISQSIHLKGINPQWTLYDSPGQHTLANVVRNSLTGDLTITVPSSLPSYDGRFAGSIDID